MSRYIRQTGSSGGGATYGDSDVCTLLPSYTGALSSSDGTNICCIRNDWELICECNCIDTCHGTCVEYTFPSTADGCCIFSEYKLEVNGLHHNSTAGSCLIMRIGSADCYCTACSGMFRCMGPSASTNRFSCSLCLSCVFVMPQCWRGGTFVGCFRRHNLLESNGACGFGIYFDTYADGCQLDHCVFGREANETHATRWEKFCKVNLHHGGSCPMCQCGSFRIYGKRFRPTAYSGYTIVS